jgi:hypothetical protein
VAGDVVHEVERFGVVLDARPVDVIGDPLAADLLDLLHAAGKGAVLEFFDLAAFVQAHRFLLSKKSKYRMSSPKG